MDVVLVLDSERLYNDFQKDLPNNTSILRLPKSGGVSNININININNNSNNINNNNNNNNINNLVFNINDNKLA